MHSQKTEHCSGKCQQEEKSIEPKILRIHSEHLSYRTKVHLEKMAPCELIENQLCDIQLPEQVSFWPIAPGYWIVAIVLIVLLSTGGLWLYQYYSQSIKGVALRELKQLRQHYQKNDDSVQLLIALSILLRRVALVVFPRHQVAGLSGIAWLQFLDQSAGMTKEFSEGEGRVLCTGPYQKSPPIYNAEKLFNLVEAWIKQ